MIKTCQVFKSTITKKFIWIIALVQLFTILPLTLSLYLNFSHEVEKSLGMQLQNIARTASLLIRPDDHERVQNDFQNQIKSLEQQPHFLRIQHALQMVKKENQLKAHVYTLINPSWVKDKMLFMVMSNKKTYVGNALALNATAQSVFKTGRSAYTSIYEDKEGSWVSAFAPIIDEFGNVIALIEIDYDAKNEVYNAKVTIAKLVIGVSFIIFFIGIIVAIFIGRSLASPILELSRASEKISSGNFEVSINPRGQDELALLGHNFNKMITDIKLAREKIEEYSHQMEVKVAEKTKDLSNTNILLTSILDSLGQGIFVFDKHSNILPTYSKASEKLLENKMGEIPLWELLKSKKTMINDWVDILFQNVLPFKDSKTIGPSKLPHSDNRSILLDYQPMNNDSGEMVGVVVVATDNTAEVNAKKRELEEINFSKMIVKIAKNQKDFINFYNQVNALFIQSIDLLDKKDLNMSHLIESINIDLHTIKGAVSLFHFEAICSHLHDLEQSIYDGGFDSFDIASTKATLIDIYEEFTEFNTKINAMLPSISVFEDSVIITKETLKDFSKKLESPELRNAFIDSFIKESAESLFYKYDDLIKQVARDQNKEVYSIKFSGDKVKIDSTPYLNLITSFVHIFRNIIDHGIEDIKTRELLGKDPVGSVSVNFKQDNSSLEIRFSDDGKGIDTSQIRKNIQKTNSNAPSLSEQELLQMIFKPGLSTNEEVTKLSGRGVGMSAVAAEVRSLGGTITVESKLNEFTAIVINIPLLTVV